MEEIDITPHLPTYFDYCLTEKDKAYLDFLFDARSFPALYEYTVDAKEYCQIDDRKVPFFLRGGKDKDIQAGDEITVTFAHLRISATVTGLRPFFQNPLYSRHHLYYNRDRK